MLTPLAITALALLNERSMHPYEMYQLMLERHQDRLVKVRPGSLYHTVERLQDQELVESIGTERAGNRPERTTYAITQTGREALVARVHEILSTPINEYPRFPVALSEAHNEPRELVIEDLRSYAATLAELIDEIAAVMMSARERGVPEAYWVAADYVHSMHRAKHDWINHFITRLETEEFPWPQPRP